jgi:NAD(P)-dependent dehydrogenase (short-subunit alcohol dehydrogenase family)
VDRLIQFCLPDIALCYTGIVHACAVLDYSSSEWDRILNVNLSGVFLISKAAARSTVERGNSGKIIFTSSWVQDVPWPEITPYSVTKAGLKALMRGMARELAGKRITVNSIAPGIVGAGMARRQWDSDPSYRKTDFCSSVRTRRIIL